MNKRHLKMLRARIAAEWGDTCEDHDADCPVCKAWDFYYEARATVDKAGRDNAQLDRV